MKRLHSWLAWLRLMRRPQEPDFKAARLRAAVARFTLDGGDVTPRWVAPWRPWLQGED